MPYIYTKADELEGTELVGTHQCVALIQHYAKAPVSSAWRQGEHAVDATALLTEVSSGSFRAEVKRKTERTFEQAITPMRFTLLSDGSSYAYQNMGVSSIVCITRRINHAQSCATAIAGVSRTDSKRVCEVIDVPGDWLPYVASPLYLHAAAPMYGPPELKGDLTDFKEARTANEWSYTYALDGAFPEGKWLQCAYGERNQVTLSRRLPDETQECKFTYRKGAKAGQHGIKIQCK